MKVKAGQGLPRHSQGAEPPTGASTSLGIIRKADETLRQQMDPILGLRTGSRLEAYFSKQQALIQRWVGGLWFLNH